MRGGWHLLFFPQTLFLTLVESVVSTSHSSPQRGYPEVRAALKLPPFFRFHKRYDSWRATWVFLGGVGSGREGGEGGQEQKLLYGVSIFWKFFCPGNLQHRQGGGRQVWHCA